MTIEHTYHDELYRRDCLTCNPSHGADYCGCCGRVITAGTTWWCVDCLREHVDTLARPEDATYFAQHGEDCPYQV